MHHAGLFPIDRMQLAPLLAKTSDKTLHWPNRKGAVPANDRQTQRVCLLQQKPEEEITHTIFQSGQVFWDYT